MTAERQRVDRAACFVLHTRPIRETSLLVDVFSRDHGRVMLMARGARRPRSSIRGLLMAFQPLELSWAGRGEVKTLHAAEWVGGLPLLAGEALFSGYYLNELLLALLPREDAHAQLFDLYAETLRALSGSQAHEAALRRFECGLFQELGYGLSLDSLAGSDVVVESEGQYTVDASQGVLAADHGSGPVVSGETLLALAEGEFVAPRQLAEAKLLMRYLLGQLLGGRPLQSRRIMMELGR